MLGCVQSPQTPPLTTGTERTGELQEGSGTNKPGGKEETEQKGETGHKAASLAPREQDLGGLLQKAPGAPVIPSPTARGKEQHPLQKQLSTLEICFMRLDFLMRRNTLSFLQLTSNTITSAIIWMTFPALLEGLSTRPVSNSPLPWLLHRLKCPTPRGSRFLLRFLIQRLVPAASRGRDAGSGAQASHAAQRCTNPPCGIQHHLTARKQSFTHALILRELTARGRNAGQQARPAWLGLHAGVLFSNFACLWWGSLRT